MGLSRWIVGVAIVGVVIGACLQPTEILVDITTNDCQGLSHVDIFINGSDAAATAPAAVASGCQDADGGVVGSLAIVPSGSDTDEVTITVEGAPTSAQCAADAGCIVARRRLEYIPHHPLTVPIYLDSACAGFPCPANTTCVAHDGVPTCVDDHGTCDQVSNKCDIDGGAADGGAGDGAVEAGSACTAPGVFNSAPKYKWSLDSTTFEDNGLFQDAIVGMNSITGASPVTGCGPYLHTVVAQPLATTMPVFSHIAIAFYYRAGGAATLFTLGPTTTPTLSAVVTAGALSVDAAGAASDFPMPAAGVWHAVTIEVVAATSVFYVTVDGNKSPAQALKGPLVATGDLTVGGANITADFDEVEVFDLP